MTPGSRASEDGEEPAGPGTPDISPTTPSAASEWRANWLLVLTCTIGMSLPTISLYSLGLFFEPLENEFGWTRAQISFGLTMYAMVNVPLGPFVGALMDRWGARRIAIPGVIAFGIIFSSFSLVGPSPSSWWAVWAISGVAVLCIKPTVWLIAISSRFVTAPGTAMAVALSGTAIASFLSPILARWLIEELGWRLAYVSMGVGWSGIVLLLVLMFFYDARDRERVALKTRKSGQGTPVRLPGKTFREAIRDPAFIKVCVASFLIQIVIVGTTVHLLPMLTLRGLSREAAAGVVSIVGLSAALGKVVAGWLFDRMDPRPIAGISLALPAIPLLVLALWPQGEAMSLAVAIPTAALLGFATGGELSATAYLASRYVGLVAFGKNYGIISSIMAFSAGVGPLVAGTIYDRTGDYLALLIGGAPAALIASALVFTLPALPDLAARRRT